MALAISRYPLGPYQANCYVVRAASSAPEAVVVDPGAQAAELRLELARAGARCAAILVTHTDLDHIGAVAELAEGTGAEVWCPAGEADVLRDPASTPRGGGMRAHEPEHLVSGGDVVSVAGIDFEVLDVPGHSSGHVAYHAQSPDGGGCLFSGDVLFSGSIGRTDLPGGDWDALVDSIRTLFDRFPPDTVVYSGHGPETTLGAERATNPFLAELRVS
ncbi:MAG TPA: MBL fold metallo-hydrolase [Gaiellaceae bacterium]|jgi:glyoxylase-like metal-dependent hydrolase (beta-lactamase superfamily II)|nr:MBL fold metallo-hydrolase [Gaiellaceae bacterium]